MFSLEQGTGAANVRWWCTASLFWQALFSQILIFFCLPLAFFLLDFLSESFHLWQLWRNSENLGIWCLDSLQESAESLEKEQKAQRGLNSPVHPSEGLILEHDQQGINADCNSSPYTREEMESYRFALFILPTSMLGWCLKIPSPILPHLKGAAWTKFVQEVNRKGAVLKVFIETQETHRQRI